ncbi:MAG: C69 family dipeptidase [Desulfoplanes sp.]|jgi:hypothetical protein|nr:C69 family dipeptidase [Desulfoplanes sp.]
MFFLGLDAAQACTTLLVTKGASTDGSVFVAHSDDSELFADQRLVYVPAANHKPGEMRPVYYDACSIGERSQFLHGYSQPRYVGIDRGSTYIDSEKPQSIPLGYIPPVGIYLRLL